MTVVYKDISQLSQESNPTGNEKIPISGTKYITVSQIRPTVSSDITADKANTDKMTTPKSVYDFVGNPVMGLSVPNPYDGTVIFTHKNGDTTTLDLNHTHPQYGLKESVDTSQPAGGMLPNTLYVLGTKSGAVTFTFASPADQTIANRYRFTFDSGSTAAVPTWPSEITSWAGNCLDSNGEPEISADKHYEVKAMGGYAIIMEFAIGSSPTPSDLPSGAIACELIYSTGYDKYIESGLTPSASMSYEVDVLWNQPQSDMQVVFGYYTNSIRYNPLSRDTMYLEPGYGNYYTGNWPTKYGGLRCKHKVVATPTGTTIDTYTPDGQTLLNSQTFTYTSSVTLDQTMALLGRKEGNSFRSGSWRGGLGRMKCYGDDHFGTLVADYIPCYYNGNFGLWDTVARHHLIGTTPSDIKGFGENWDTQGFYPNCLNSYDAPMTYNEWLIPERDYVTSRLFEVPAGCTQVQFRGASSALGNQQILLCLASDKTYKDWYSYNAVDRIITLPTGTAYLRLSMAKNDMDNCYLKDYTNSQYIWKGQNVT